MMPSLPGGVPEIADALQRRPGDGAGPQPVKPIESARGATRRLPPPEV